MRAAMMLRSAGMTDAGRVRRHNEDAFLDRRDIGLWAVADGMGGHARGDRASGMIMERLDAIPVPASGAELLGDVRRALAEVHGELRAEGRALGDREMIGSTVVVLMIHGGRFVCLWAGDSRLYLLRDRQLWQITRDHSHVQELIDRGVITEDQARDHPAANIITRAVGAFGDLALEMEAAAVLPGDRFLLCTDGIARCVGDGEIADVIANFPAPRAVQTLKTLALSRNAPDNIAAVALACDAIEDVTLTPWSRPHG
ncbi:MULTISPECIES: PP2C family serine/threonine-protein phosphatase [Tistrella]|jgi:serine/threonine protein phosphatase PrpC|uniref:Ser/Thr protein phosphatase n=1 Tax=Tistrella mobilis (strain KA081020-065) TaxID=1110502 RepID=I3TRU0_TISMK|nr:MULTISPECIES: PP2C family serine/threonine-protein phosphatase [Tistrella]AFK55478.1 Ser/Thr protein phosphatase [Tistrella mobilis KA081020-065]MAD38642.1 serine/threonine-protein phosphatase [Tistrella sp.]MAM77194.1 serine/threonine-protein phosphatase [Tistrella sp.]